MYKKLKQKYKLFLEILIFKFNNKSTNLGSTLNRF